MVPSKEMDEGRNMAEIKLKKREEMDPAYCWDLSSLFGSDEEFEKTEQELAKKIEAFRAKQGTMKESAKALYDVLSGLDDKPIIYEQEFFPELHFLNNDAYTITRADDGAFELEGPKIEKMLGYTNIDSEKGFLFFQRFLKEQGILKELEKMGIEDGDTVRMYGMEFDYYQS